MLEARAQFVTFLDTAVRDRILNAEPISLFSDHDDKLVEVVRDINDTQFVRRSYSPKAVRDIESVGLPFTQARDTFCMTFTDAGFTVVPSVVLYQPFDNDYPVVIACDYVEGTDVKSASVEMKTEAATKLASTLKASSRFFPHIETFTPSMFMVRRDEAGAEELVLVDVDPYLANFDYLEGTTSPIDRFRALHIDSFTHLLSGMCSGLDQRKTVISAFVRSLGFMTADLNSQRSPLTLKAIMDAHTKAQGIDFQF